MDVFLMVDPTPAIIAHAELEAQTFLCSRKFHTHYFERDNLDMEITGRGS